MPEPLALERDGRIARLVLDAPPGNRMDRRFFDRFARVLAGPLAADPPAGLIVHGHGRHFSSGADLDELRDRLAREPEGTAAGLLEASFAFQRLAELPFPTVAAVGGCCLGSGLELALACRARVAAANAVFSLPEATFDLLPGCGGTVRLPGLVGRGRAIELILTGRTVAAAEARAMGLVDAVVDRRDLLDKAARLLADLPLSPPLAQGGRGDLG